MPGAPPNPPLAWKCVFKICQQHTDLKMMSLMTISSYFQIQPIQNSMVVSVLGVSKNLSVIFNLIQSSSRTGSHFTTARVAVFKTIKLR